MVDTFLADLKDAVKDAKVAPSGKGSMVAVYGKSDSIIAPFLYIPSIPWLLPPHRS